MGYNEPYERIPLQLRRKNTHPSLDDVIAQILIEMNRLGPEAPEYSNLVAHLNTLTALKASNRRSPLSLDTLALVLGNLAGIVIIVGFERGHVFTSQAAKQLIRPKPD